MAPPTTRCGVCLNTTHACPVDCIFKPHAPAEKKADWGVILAFYPETTLRSLFLAVTKHEDRDTLSETLFVDAKNREDAAAAAAAAANLPEDVNAAAAANAPPPPGNGGPGAGAEDDGI